MTPEEPKPESKAPEVPAEPTAPSPPEPTPEPPKLPYGKRVPEVVDEEVEVNADWSDDSIRKWYGWEPVVSRRRELAAAIVALILFGLIPLSCTGLFWVVCGKGFH